MATESIHAVGGDQSSGPLITRKIREDLGHVHRHAGKEYSPGADIVLTPAYERILDSMGVLAPR